MSSPKYGTPNKLKKEIEPEKIEYVKGSVLDQHHINYQNGIKRIE